jgi:hypothetical protein
MRTRRSPRPHRAIACERQPVPALTDSRGSALIPRVADNGGARQHQQRAAHLARQMHRGAPENQASKRAKAARPNDKQVNLVPERDQLLARKTKRHAPVDPVQRPNRSRAARSIISIPPRQPTSRAPLAPGPAAARLTTVNACTEARKRAARLRAAGRAASDSVVSLKATPIVLISRDRFA